MQIQLTVKRGSFQDLLTDAVVSWLAIHFAEQLSSPKPLRPQELVLTGGFPCYHIYETRDEKYIVVGALEEKFWTKLCTALGVPEFTPYQFSDEKRAEIFQSLKTIFVSKTQAEWLKELDPREIPISPVLNLVDVAQDPHMRERTLIQKDELGIAFPVRMTHSQQEKDRLAPELGEHTREILSELGYSQADIDGLASRGVI